MPLINKTKSYKSDIVSKSKALTWLCLIENIGNRCSSYLTNVIIPFLNYCFGLSSESMTHETESISSQTDNLMKSKRAGTTIPSTATTTFSESLYKIGIEFYVSFLCNGSRDNIPADIIANGLKNSS
jgi:hypothetical protein